MIIYDFIQKPIKQHTFFDEDHFRGMLLKQFLIKMQASDLSLRDKSISYANFMDHIDKINIFDLLNEAMKAIGKPNCIFGDYFIEEYNIFDIAAKNLKLYEECIFIKVKNPTPHIYNNGQTSYYYVFLESNNIDNLINIIIKSFKLRLFI